MYLNLFIIQQNNKSTALYAPRTIKLYTLRLPSLFSVTGPPSCLRVSKKTVIHRKKNAAKPCGYHQNMAVSEKFNSVPSPSLKDYVFTERLGSGTYATVYKAFKKVTVYTA